MPQTINPNNINPHDSQSYPNNYIPKNEYANQNPYLNTNKQGNTYNNSQPYNYYNPQNHTQYMNEIPIQYQQYTTCGWKTALGIISIVAGAISLLLEFVIYFLSTPIALGGLILGIVPLITGTKNKALSIIGIVLCSLSILIAIFLFISFIVFIFSGW